MSEIITAKPLRVRKDVLDQPRNYDWWMDLRRDSPRAFYSPTFLKLMRQHREMLGYEGFYGEPKAEKGNSDNA